MALSFHPVADIFPLMPEAELASLAEDIHANGLREPIWLCDGQILDGRNRYLACERVGVAPETREWAGADPVAFVVSMNLHRRHLNESQRGMIAANLAILPHGGTMYATGDMPSGISLTQPEAAKLLNVSVHTVQRARQVREHGTPEMIKAVGDGTLTVARAVTEMKRAQVKDGLADIRRQEAQAIVGVYDVIVIDPPWQMEKIEREVAPNQVAFDYPTMSVKEIGALSLPVGDDCHVWLWTTQKYLPHAFEILQKWGLRYVCAFVWHKPGGFQPFDLPQYNCEFVLYARSGKPKFVDLKEFMLCFNAPRHGHSVKPEEFYAMVRRVTAGRRLDMFGRRRIEGFDSWGKEAPGALEGQ